MALPPDDPSYLPPRTLKPEDNPVPGSGADLPENPKPPFVPASKEEADTRVATLESYFAKYQEHMLKSGQGFQVSGSGPNAVIKRRVDGDGGDDEEVAALRAAGYSEGEIIKQRGNSGGSSREEWEQDTEGQLLYNAWQDAIADAKSIKSNLPNVRSYLDTEEDKTSEITRQFKDFAARADEYDQLLKDERQFAMSSDEANASAYKNQQASGQAAIPFYADLPSTSSLSRILRPSLPDYVRPDYRLNAAVGLPGPEGFDDPNYDANGMPMYAGGTEDGIPIKRLPPIFWPWGAK